MKVRANEGKLNMKHCAFCKFWYDPAHTAITPVKGLKGVWEYDSEEKRPCLKWNNMEKKALYCCKYYIASM